MSFAADLQRFRGMLKDRSRALVENVGDHVETSIKVGSPVTGAPGQPVDEGNLLNSWHSVRIGPYQREIVSDSPYAKVIEENERGAILRSSVGGYHSMALTRAGFPNLVDHELAKLQQRR